MSTTNAEITLNVIAELFGGLWFPGNATAMNYFKSYGFVTTSHTLHFAQDLKLAHYIHIPPWVTFNCQMVATLVSTLVCTAILNYQMTQIPDVCTPNQKDRLPAPDQHLLHRFRSLGYTRSEEDVWSGAIYNNLLWCFLIGAFMPIPSTTSARSQNSSNTSTLLSSSLAVLFGHLTTYLTLGWRPSRLRVQPLPQEETSLLGGRSTTSEYLIQQVPT